jgi:hypothetical protein
MGAMERMGKPADGDERSITVGWLRFHRDALSAKCEGLTPEQLVRRPCPPSPLSLLGLVRHLTEQERVCGYSLGQDTTLHFVYGEYTDDGPDWDFDADVSMVADSFASWERERDATDAAIGRLTDLDASDTGGAKRSARWSLQKLVGEYARHNGHADLLREQLDGATGE